MLLAVEVCSVVITPLLLLEMGQQPQTDTPTVVFSIAAARLLQEPRQETDTPTVAFSTAAMMTQPLWQPANVSAWPKLPNVMQTAP